GKVAKIFVDIFVLPLPLVAGYLDINIRLGGVVHINQGGGGGNCHNDENDKRYERPEDLDHRILMKIGRFCALGLAMGKDRPEHDPENHGANGNADPENGHMKVEY